MSMSKGEKASVFFLQNNENPGVINKYNQIFLQRSVAMIAFLSINTTDYVPE